MSGHERGQPARAPARAPRRGSPAPPHGGRAPPAPDRRRHDGRRDPGRHRPVDRMGQRAGAGHARRRRPRGARRGRRRLPPALRAALPQPPQAARRPYADGAGDGGRGLRRGGGRGGARGRQRRALGAPHPHPRAQRRRRRARLPRAAAARRDRALQRRGALREGLRGQPRPGADPAARRPAPPAGQPRLPGDDGLPRRGRGGPLDLRGRRAGGREPARARHRAAAGRAHRAADGGRAAAARGRREMRHRGGPADRRRRHRLHAVHLRRPRRPPPRRGRAAAERGALRDRPSGCRPCRPCWRRATTGACCSSTTPSRARRASARPRWWGATRSDLQLWSDPKAGATIERLLREDGRVRDLDLRLRTADGGALDCLVAAEAVEIHGQRCMLVDGAERVRAQAHPRRGGRPPSRPCSATRPG